MKRLALFDLDNTLLAGDSDYEWGQFMCDQGVVERAEYEAQNRACYDRSRTTPPRSSSAGTANSCACASAR
jgi:phosphoserine phosphatase